MLEILINFVNNYLVHFVVSLLCAAAVLLIGLKVSKFLVERLCRTAFVKKLDTNVQSLLKSSLKITLNIIVVVITVQILGVPSATIVTVLGSCGLAVGLALQGGLSNLAGGIMIMFFKPFHIGDYITTDKASGTVEEIGIFYTRLKAVDNQDICIPNSVLSNTTVTNVPSNSKRRLDIDLSISYDADIDRVRSILSAIADNHNLILKDPAFQVLVSAQADSAVIVTLRVWVNSADYWDVKFDLLEDTKKAFDKFNIEIPYNKLDVHIKNS